MLDKTLKRSFWLIMLVGLGGALADESESGSESEADAAAQADGIDETIPAIERCFSVRSMTDFVVISDQHVYIQTRGRNHYLMTTDVCKDLQRSYHRQQTRFVPYGQTVCENDGSYLVYDEAGRDSPCHILSIQRVESRQEAKQIAEAEQGLAEFETVTPVDTPAE